MQCNVFARLELMKIGGLNQSRIIYFIFQTESSSVLMKNEESQKEKEIVKIKTLEYSNFTVILNFEIHDEHQQRNFNETLNKNQHTRRLVITKSACRNKMNFKTQKSP